MMYLVVDLEFGCLDGWYSDKVTAEEIAESIKQSLGHDRVIVVEYANKGAKNLEIGRAFFSERFDEVQPLIAKPNHIDANS